MEYRNDIEELVKNTFENYEAEVSPHAWMNIQSGLNIQPAPNAGSGGNNISTASRLAGASSKFSAGSIIGTAAAIIGITASVIYFSSENKAIVNNNPVNEIKVAQDALPVASAEKESTGFVKNERKSEQAAPSEKQESDTKKENPSKEKTAYYSSTNEDVTVSSMNKKDAPAVTEEKHKADELKEPESKSSGTASDVAAKPSEENSNIDNASTPSDEPEIKSETPATADKKAIEKYLGQIPNVITPNGDGNNDAFIIEGKDLLNLKVSITDMSTGKMVHHWNNLHGFWDGRLENGQPAKEGRYFYNIFAQPIQGKPITKQGILNLILK